MCSKIGTFGVETFRLDAPTCNALCEWVNFPPHLLRRMKMGTSAPPQQAQFGRLVAY